MLAKVFLAITLIFVILVTGTLGSGERYVRADKNGALFGNSIRNRDSSPCGPCEKFKFNQCMKTFGPKCPDELQEPIPRLFKDKEVNPEKRKPTRWRQRNEKHYDRNDRKRSRNYGQQYTSKKTKSIFSFREIGEPCECKNKCREKLQAY
ncbi:uncharacterized protein [Diabrotica undecimpunctata]|uniref:uncharacterized protein n=1 Tax=Diabrotica undecimpunctata TaxID=50387 RepID=UPI003B631AF9